MRRRAHRLRGDNEARCKMSAVEAVADWMPQSEDALGEGGAAIDMCDVSRSFGNVTAVDHVSLSISSGEFFTLLGPSGSGKTTLLQLVAGFQEPDSGDIRVDGKTVSGLPPFRRGIGVVFQSYALFPHMSVFENVAFPLRVRKVGRAEIVSRVHKALDLVHMADYGQRRPSQLSGGQQQRVALARALVFGPRLLLMDEPLSALDAKLRKVMRAEIKSLQRNIGVTVIYVTHDQDEALALSDRIAVMRNGRVEQLAAPAELYERPESSFVASFIGDSNLLEAQVLGREGENLVLSVAGRYKFKCRHPHPVSRDAAVHLAIRPEHVMLSPDSSASNVASGQVIATSFGGDHIAVDMDIGNGVKLTAKLRVPVAPEIGSQLTVGWTSERSVVLVDDPSHEKASPP
jgi:putative spermidine/putrescine transport system ATP-binding protein